MNATSTPENGSHETLTAASALAAMLPSGEWTHTHAATLRQVWDDADQHEREALRQVLGCLMGIGELTPTEVMRQHGYDSGYVDGQAVVTEAMFAELLRFTGVSESDSRAAIG